MEWNGMNCIGNRKVEKMVEKNRMKLEKWIRKIEKNRIDREKWFP